MTPAEAVVAALLDGDVAALRALLDSPVGEVAAAGLARLAPDDLTADELAVLRLVSGHPGLSATELTALDPAFRAAAPRLLELGLVTSSRFDRADCWARTGRGAQVLRGG